MYQVASSRSGSPYCTTTYHSGSSPSSTHHPPSERLSFLYGSESVGGGGGGRRPTDIVIKDHKRTIEVCVVPVLVLLVTLGVIALIAHQLVKGTLNHWDEDHHNHHHQIGTGNATSSDPASAQCPYTDQSDRCESDRRRRLVVQMARESWSAYRRHAWPSDALRPVTREPYSDLFGPQSGLTIVSAASTLWLMGLRAEFEQAREWVRDQLHLGALRREVDLQHSVNYYLGALLSCYALTGDPLFLNKSIEIADLLAPAYQTPTGLLC